MMRNIILTLVSFIIISCSTRVEKKELKPTIDSNDLNSNLNTIEDLKAKASVFYMTDDYLEAAKLFKQILEIDSMNAEITYKLGFCLAQLDQDSDAVRYFEKSISFQYRVFDSNKNLGLLYLKSSIYNKEEAKKYFNRCNEINPNDEIVNGFLKELNTKANDI